MTYPRLVCVVWPLKATRCCAEYGIGSGLFFVGYTTFQIPSQLIVRSVGAPAWLAVIVTIWGITAASMAAITSPYSFYIVRMLLGFAEAGSFPGYWYYLTHFYPDSRITLPFAVTDSAIMVAQVRLPTAAILPSKHSHKLNPSHHPSGPHSRHLNLASHSILAHAQGTDWVRCYPPTLEWRTPYASAAERWTLRSTPC